MSYDAVCFTVKGLKDLVIPLKAFRSLYQRENLPDGTTILHFGEDQEIEGTVKNNKIHVSKIKWSGEGSGHYYVIGLEPALSFSKGTLIAGIAWEDQEIEILSSIDGIVTLTPFTS